MLSLGALLQNMHRSLSDFSEPKLFDVSREILPLDFSEWNPLVSEEKLVIVEKEETELTSDPRSEVGWSNFGANFGFFTSKSDRLLSELCLLRLKVDPLQFKSFDWVESGSISSTRGGNKEFDWISSDFDVPMERRLLRIKYNNIFNNLPELCKYSGTTIWSNPRDGHSWLDPTPESWDSPLKQFLSVSSLTWSLTSWILGWFFRLFLRGRGGKHFFRSWWQKCTRIEQKYSEDGYDLMHIETGGLDELRDFSWFIGALNFYDYCVDILEMF